MIKNVYNFYTLNDLRKVEAAGLGKIKFLASRQGGYLKPSV